MNNGMVAIPIAGGLAGSAIDHQIARSLPDLFVDIVHQHAHGGFLLPAFAGKSRAARSADGRVGGSFSLYRHESMVVVNSRRRQHAGMQSPSGIRHTPEEAHSHRKVPLSPAFGIRVGDDIVDQKEQPVKLGTGRSSPTTTSPSVICSSIGTDLRGGAVHIIDTALVLLIWRQDRAFFLVHGPVGLGGYRIRGNLFHISGLYQI